MTIPDRITQRAVAHPGTVFIAPLDALDDEDRWVEIGRVTSDGLQTPEGIDLVGSDDGFAVAMDTQIVSLTQAGPRYASGGHVPPPRQFSFDGVDTSQLQWWAATGLPPASHAPGRGREQAPAPAQRPSDALEQIDRAVAGLCPCGAEPVEQWAPYCSYDCKPNVAGPDTDRRESGELATPMRWRPDLVTAADEVAMTEYTQRQVRDGLGHQVWLYPGGERVQLRVDDGYRFIGGDLDRAVYDADEQASTARWEALRREFGNQRHLIEPERGFSMADALAYLARQRRAPARGMPGRCPGPCCNPRPPEVRRQETVWSWTPRSAWDTRGDHLHIAVDVDSAEAVRGAISAMSAWEIVRRAFDHSHRLREIFGLSEPEEEPAEPQEDPRERALRLRRERNTGPRQQARAPQRIDPHRSR